MRILLCLACFLLGLSPLYANVVITGTRVVYPAQQKEVTVQLDNVGTSPSLVQAWIDNGNDQVTPDATAVPFVLTPPIFRLDAGKGQTLRLLYTQEPLPQDRESIFYLNILDIPPKPNAENPDTPHNFLQLSIRSRLKLFFRPAGLTPPVATAADTLQLNLSGKTLQLHNPTPYYITISKITLLKDAQTVTVLPQVPMLPPFGQTSLTLPASAAAATQAQVHTINDYGGITETDILLK
ncbi:MAG: fimbria/pilus periplasmic chaperone [Neisseria sp.]|nr:fimbria/pilus periplasmic chaperone [Neisseria sp.]